MGGNGGVAGGRATFFESCWGDRGGDSAWGCLVGWARKSKSFNRNRAGFLRGLQGLVEIFIADFVRI